MTTQSLQALIDATGLKTVALSDQTLAIPFHAEHAENLVVQARELADHLAYFCVALPNPGWLGEEAALTNLLRVSFAANYVKALRLGEDTIGMATEMPMEWLTPSIAEGLIRGLSHMGDVRKGDLQRWDLWEKRAMGCALAQAQHIHPDPAQSEAETARLAAAAGLQVKQIKPGLQLLEMPIAQVPIKVSARHAASLSSFIVSFSDLKPKGNKKEYLRKLLKLNQQLNIVRLGLDSDGDVSILYETPVIPPDIFERLNQSMGMAVLGLMAD